MCIDLIDELDGLVGERLVGSRDAKLIDQEVVGDARDRLDVDAFAGKTDTDELWFAGLEGDTLATVTGGVDVGDIVAGGGEPTLRSQQRR